MAEKIPIRRVVENKKQKLQNGKTTLNLFLSVLVGLIFAGIFCAGVYVLATTYGEDALYPIGNTLNPTNCDPGDTYCKVVAPQEASSALTSVAGLTWTSGSPLVKMTAAGTFGLDTTTYLSAALTSLNGLTGASQTFGIGTTGTAPAWSSATTVHTLNIPMASTAGVTAGLLSKTDYDTFSGKLSAESDTLAIVTGRGALTTTLTQFQNAGGLEVGKDDATNTAGVIKFWGAGANNFYTTLTAGTQSANATYTLPTAMPASTGFLKSTDAGVMSWDTNTYLTSLSGALLADGTVTGATSQAQVFTNGVRGSLYDNAGTPLLSIDPNGRILYADDGTTPVFNYAGGDNVIIGEGAGNAITTSQYNVLLGYDAGGAVTSGNGSVAIGYQALASGVDTASYSTVVGFQAGYNSTVSVNAFGNSALFSNTTGQNNAAFGGSALAQNSTGSSNTAFGQSAGNSITGDNNTLVGYYAGNSSSGSDNTIVGANAQGTSGQNYATLIGSGVNSTGNGGVAVGYGVFGSGGGDYQVGIGFGTFGSNSSGSSNTGVGYYVMNSGTGSYNTLIGDSSFTSNTGDNNTALGYYTGYSATGASNSVFLGYNAGKYETASNKLFIDAVDRGDEATGRTNSLIYGVFDGTVANQTIAFNAGLVSFGSDTAGGATNVPGSIKLFSNGDDAYYTTLTAGTQTANATYTLPTAMPASSGYVLSATDAGVMSWVANGAGGGVFSLGATDTTIYSSIGGTPTGQYNFIAGVGAGNANPSGSSDNFLGYNAGYYNSTGAGNNFFGDQAGYSNTTGFNNTFIGEKAGYSNVAGNNMVAIGDRAGYYFSSATTANLNNVFIGPEAGYGQTGTSTGTDNTFIGYQAGYYNTTGSYDNFLGYQAGRYNITGSSDNFLGYQAGYYNTTGAGNNFLGDSAGYSNTTGFNNTFIGEKAGYSNVAGNNMVAIGDRAGYYFSSATTANLNNVFIGPEAGYGQTGTSTGTDNNFIGSRAGYANTTGSYNNFFGYQAGYVNTTGSYNNFFGGYVGLSNTTGSSDNFLGRSAGYLNTTGAGNNFFGDLAGGNNTTGFNNTFIGERAGYSNVAGNNMVAIGDRAGYYFSSATTANLNNVFIGPEAGYGQTGTSTGTDNTFIGYQAGYYNTTGQSNNFLGFQAGYLTTTGSYNNFLGYMAGRFNTTGSSNVAIGDYAGYTNSTGTNNVFLGSSAGRYETASNALYIDNQDRTNTAGDKANALLYGTFAAAAANQQLTINGTLNLSQVAAYDGTALKLCADGVGVCKATSSLRYKEDIQPLEDDWNKILQLTPVSFKYVKADNRSFGYIAENLDALGLKNLVIYDTKGRPDAIQYDKIPLYVLEITKQQQIDINTLKQRLGISTETVQINQAGTVAEGAVAGVTLSGFDQSVQTALANMGVTLSSGIMRMKEIFADNATIKVARINQMEMVDSETGDIYCTWIKAGEMVKVKGDCSTVTTASVTTAVSEVITASATNPATQQAIDEAQRTAERAQRVAQQAQQTAQQASQQVQQTVQQTQDQVEQVQEAQEQVQDQVEEVQEQISQQSQIPVIVSVAQIPDINVDYNTNINLINLPDIVSVTISDDTTQDSEITWDDGTPEYDKKTSGTYVFSGDLTSPQDVINADKIKATVNVIVGEDPSEVVSQAVEDTVEAVAEAIPEIVEAIQEAGASLLNATKGFGSWISSVTGSLLNASIFQKFGASLVNATKFLSAGLIEPFRNLFGK